MTQSRTADSWNQRYLTGDLPWDSGRADPCLLDTISRLELRGARALEIGCGTGVNAVAMALHSRSFTTVTAIDIAPRAIEMAIQRAAAAGVTGINFRAHDILAAAPVPAASVDFVFDRGVFHSVAAEQRPVFAQRVADALATDGEAGKSGWWLSLCGCADDKTPGGPPRMTLAEITGIVEPCFEIHEARRSRFRDIKERASDVYLCWQVLMKKRHVEKKRDEVTKR